MVRAKLALVATARVGVCLLALIGIACGKAPGEALSPSITAVTPATHDRFPILSGPHAVDCNVCHGNTASFREFNCTACHAHDQGLTDQLHNGAAGYSYTATSCYGCHADGARHAFDHAGITAGCAACHALGAPFAALPFTPVGGGTFTHPDMNGNDCAACHSRTSWQAGATPAGRVSDPARNVVVDALVPTWAGTSIATFTPRTYTLAMAMNHASNAVPSTVMNGCANCHVITGSGSYYPGNFHASLATLALPQPDTCLDCHSTSMLVGFVGPMATNPARNPPSPEMKHDAVAWSAGNPAMVTQDCGQCHLPPMQAAGGGWGVGRSGSGPALYHASMPAAPSSCIDCHANTRPSGVLTAGVAKLPGGVQFDHAASVAMGDCVSCHASTSSWTGGKFHLADSATPASCVLCHEGERPTSTANWKSTTYASSPFDYGGNALGKTHGDGLECATCHAGPGTGAWGSTQNWVGGSFAHGDGTPAASTCGACHSSQRPDLNGVQPSKLGGFDHAANATIDCIACHEATVTRGSYVDYLPIPGGDWSGGLGPPAALKFDGTQDVTVTAQVPTYVGTSITMVTAQTEHLQMPMNHGSTGVPKSMACSSCHAGAATGNFTHGLLHSSLTTQPTACLDCHATSAPVGFVGPIDARRAPASGEMKHDAVLWSSGAPSTSPAVPLECSLCHRLTSGWATALKFHASVAAQPSSCLDCHANSRPALLTSANAALPAGVRFDHSTATGECATCHVSASFTSWAGGKFHLSGSATPASCVSCHEGERPTSTSNWKSTTYATSPFDYATHGVLPGGTRLDCITCHAGPGTGAWGGTQNWVGGSFGHAASSDAGTTCIACHATQRPDLVLGETTAASLLPGNFDHAVKGTDDCFSCHQATVAANAYVNYFNPSSGTLPGGDWAGGVGAPDGVRDRLQDISIVAEVPSYAGTSIVALKALAETLPMPMYHSNASVPQSMSCDACHAGAATGNFYPGRLHSSLTTQPQTCIGCHASSVPLGFVGPLDGRRTPSSGEMKHDAVLWSNGVRTTTPATPQECSICHRSTTAWVTALKFHASVAAQPTSCLDCHANSRPAVLTSANAALPAGVRFDHSTATGECTTCHVSGTLTSWTGGKFHLAGSATPASCSSCHQGERPTSTTGWISTTYQTSPFDYATHGAGLDCVTCHAGPGTGTWGSTQNWVGGRFSHGAGSLASSTCISCHATQRPDLVLGQAQAANLLPGHFDHAVKGTADCFSCHQATVSANAYVKYFNASGTLPGGDWASGVGTPDNVRDPSRDVAVVAAIPTYVGTSITTVTAQTEM
ncbi:MAG TPA: hypothetical protein VG496_07575, partial [Myxococcales bacterium]|nr:hypothetical protein [Myxococcales bacterium]